MQQKTILVVEDDKDHLTIAAALLRYYGYAVLEAMNAHDGIELAIERTPDLILMDLQLPQMNGIEALKVLRADDDTKSIPAIAFTASAMTEDRQKILEAGFDGLQTKPIHVKEFVQAIKDVLARGAGA
jgi:two-component system cell cycle response regulator DivK